MPVPKAKPTHSASSRGPLYLVIYSERNNASAVKHLCRNVGNGEFTSEARQRILTDVSDELARLVIEPSSAASTERRIVEKSELRCKKKAEKAIGAYYGVSTRTLRDWNWKKKTSTLATQKRSGRPKDITSPVKRKICDVFNEENGTSIRATAAKLKKKRVLLRDRTVYETTYSGKKRAAPSKSSVHNVVQEGKILAVKKRPKLNLENRKVRYDYASQQTKLSDAERNDNVVAIDEAWISLAHRGTGRLVEHDKATPIKENKRVHQVRSKRHPPKILVLAAITRPKMLNKDTAGPNEPARFCTVQNGKVALVRCVGKEFYKKKVYQTVNGEKILKHNVGDVKWVSVTIDGPRYKDFLVREGGVFDFIRQYFGPDVPVRFQEDGAPGHGYNNKNKRMPNAVHEEMSKIAEERKILVFKQPHNSPELNPLDLGIWYSLQSAVKHVHIDEPDRVDDAWTESQIWEACKTAWAALESRKIWNCWMVKDEILKVLVENKGAAIVHEPHTGIRARWGTQEPNI
jgi:hypothetical protein